MDEQPAPTRHRKTRGAVRPVPWALPKGQRAGNDSAASGVIQPTYSKKDVNQATSDVSAGSIPPTLTQRSSGNNSAHSGRTQPIPSNDEINSAASSTSRHDRPPRKRSSNNTAVPSERQEGSSRTLKQPIIIANEQVVLPLKMRISAKPPTHTTDHQRSTGPGESARTPLGKKTIPPNSASRFDGIPPVRIPISAGRVVETPYHAAHVSHKYCVYLADGLWKFRFSATGELTSIRRI